MSNRQFAHGPPPKVSYSLQSLMVPVLNSELEGTARLRVTLERPPSKGGSGTAYAVHPKSYEVNITLLFGATDLSSVFPRP